MKRERVPETAVGVAVAEFLRARGWGVYPEVEINRGGGAADIVATRGQVVWVIECKVSMSLELIDQVFDWMGYGHMRSVAVLQPKRRRRNAGWRILRQNGVGIFEVEHSYGTFQACEVVAPRFDRRAPLVQRTTGSLNELHKDWALPGQVSRAGGRLTPFSLTVRQVKQYVGEHPGCSMKEVVEGVKHHYHGDKTARHMLARWIEEGIITGIRIERAGRALALHLEPEC